MLSLEEEEEEHNWIFSADQIVDERAGMRSLELLIHMP
jgi:hypothetical protein